MTRARRMDRRALFASGAAAALLAATGVSADALPRRGGRLRMALSGGQRNDLFDPKLLIQPGGAGLFLQVAMVGVLFETLTEIAADGTLRGELATDWRSDANARIWHADLRQDVVFHDGAPFTAADVTSLSTMPALRNVAQIVALSDHQVRFDLKTPDPQFPFLLARPELVVLPMRTRAAALRDGIGTGSYRLRKFDAGRHLIAERIEDHHKQGRAAWFDTVEIVGIDAEAVRAEALRDGWVDVADVTDSAALGTGRTCQFLPDAAEMSAAVDSGIALPGQTGRHWPLDDLRAPQRWWMA